MSEKRFFELSKHEDDLFICSNRCINSCLPFQNLTNKVFLDTTVGKRKLPCKKCFRECAKRTKSIQCTICKRWQHTICISGLGTNALVPKYDSHSFICSDVCEIRSMPFCKLNNFDLFNEIFCDSSVPVIQTDVDKSVDIKSKSVVKSIVKRVSNDSNNSNGNNFADTFSQVYCEYVSVNDLPFVVNEGDPNNISIFQV